MLSPAGLLLVEHSWARLELRVETGDVVCRAIGSELSNPWVLLKRPDQGSDMIIMKLRKTNLAAAHV